MKYRVNKIRVITQYHPLVAPNDTIYDFEGWAMGLPLSFLIDVNRVRRKRK